MYTNFDYENEKQSIEDQVEYFFGEYSSEIRNRLLSRNLPSPTSLYDVFYPSVRNDLLSKNDNQYSKNIDEISEEIRIGQLSKVVEKTMSLEEVSEDFRKSLLARNNLHKSTVQSEMEIDEKRKDLLKRNTPSLSDLMKDSEQQRRLNVSKNNVIIAEELEETQKKHREKNLSKNTPPTKDIVDISAEYRKDLLARNIDIQKSIEEVSKKTREKNLALNSSVVNSDIESDSQKIRESVLSKNTSSDSDIETKSEIFRDNIMSKNVSKNSDLDKDSVETRKNILSKNEDKNSDIEIDSEFFRRESTNKNVSKNLDIEKDSERVREIAKSKNIISESTIDMQSKDFREVSLSKNESNNNDLEKSSKEFRENAYSKNKSDSKDIEDVSGEFRAENLSKNEETQSDLLIDSEFYRKENQSSSNSNSNDIEKASVSYRENVLSKNTPKTTGVESISEQYREDLLSLNSSIDSNLENDSQAFRDKLVSANVSNVSDLESDSENYRKNLISENIPNDSDLKEDSVSYREDLIATNISNSSDIKGSSKPYRDNLIVSNVPNGSDLEEDSESYRDNLIAVNVPSGSDLEEGSESYRDNLIAANVSNGSDIEDDSGSYRDNLIATNIPNDSDIEGDSGSYRDNLTSQNVSNGSDIEEGSGSFRDNLISQNSENDSDLSEDSESYRKQNLSKNKPSIQSIDMHFDQYGSPNTSVNERNSNLNKNVGLGPLGFNVLGPGGTSVFVGVSGVWAQGLVFRNLLTMKNKYKIQSDYYTETSGTLLENTLKVPRQSDITMGSALPMNPRETINSTISDYSEIKSPIERSLMIAKDTASAFKYFLSPYSIYSKDGKRSYEIDYDLGNATLTGKNFGLKEQVSETLPSNNINNLMRQYLKYSNPFSLDDNGKLRKENSNQTIISIANTISNLSTSSDYTQSIEDLIASYNMFNIDRLNSMVQTTTKSLVSPDESYFLSDVEGQFDENYGQVDKSIAAKTTPGNPFDSNESGFNTSSPKKGVRKILRTIASSNIKFAENFQNIQGDESSSSKSFVIGYDKIDQKNIKKAYQKYTIKNPYSPDSAGKLLFSLTNYSITSADDYQTMFFPPYISSFQNSDNASWNSTNFLGRPEAVYTYNNSSRDGSISFFVLTDYAENIVLGRYQNEDMSPVSLNIKKNFTDTVSDKIDTLNFLEAQSSELSKKIEEQKINKDVNSSSNNANNPNGTLSTSGNNSSLAYQETPSETEEQSEQKNAISILQSQKARIDSEIEKIRVELYTVEYSESNRSVRNVNDFFMNEERERIDGYIESKTSDNVTRIQEMIKSLAFQPAYFSGNLVDFKRKMEFLSKLTRPAKNTKEIGGFSFTLPPVCHLRLGDWFNHDIIVNSVSFDYSSAPWTLVDGKNQPMWASVTVNFNIVGPAGESGGVPLTSTDKEGFFGTKTVR
ncbi:MAG: hypothetical protein WC466_03270 [Candidatus Izemoplasmatales bacterium]